VLRNGGDMKELIANVREVVERCLSIDMDNIELGKTDSVMELAV
jgi:hypothetical protein